MISMTMGRLEIGAKFAVTNNFLFYIDPSTFVPFMLNDEQAAEREKLIALSCVLSIRMQLDSLVDFQSCIAEAKAYAVRYLDVNVVEELFGNFECIDYLEEDFDLEFNAVLKFLELENK